MPSLVWCLLQTFWQSEKHIRHFFPVNYLSSSKTSASKSEWIYIDSIDRTSLTYFAPKIWEVHKRLWQYCEKKELKLQICFLHQFDLIGDIDEKIAVACMRAVIQSHLNISSSASDHLVFLKRVTRDVRCIRFTYRKYQ